MQEQGDNITLSSHGRSELTVTWQPADGKPIDFSLKRQRIQANNQKWQEIIPDASLDRVFHAFLKHYRLRSKVAHGIKTAAIGVSDNGDIFVGANTENRGSNSFSRDCAEQNMVNAFHQSESTKPESHIMRLYIMGGADPGNAQDKPSFICPCGTCTDTLSKEMHGADAPVKIFPVTLGGGAPALVKAERIHDVPPDKGWDTTIGELNRHALIPYRNGEIRRWASQGYDGMLKHLLAPIHTVEKMAVDQRLDALAARGMAGNEVHHFMWQVIGAALRSRLSNAPEFTQLKTHADQQQFLMDELDYVQVAIVRLANDRYCVSVSVKGLDEPSSPPALTLASMQNQLDGKPVTDAWFTEFNPRQMAAGLMPTPNKESIERTIKRGPRLSEVRFHIVPFMRDDLNRENTEKYQLDFSASQLFPGYFKGRNRVPPPNAAQGPLVSEARHWVPPSKDTSPTR